MLKEPPPKAAALFRFNVPAVRVVPPVYVLTAAKLTVPLPRFSKESAPCNTVPPVPVASAVPLEPVTTNALSLLSEPPLSEPIVPFDNKVTEPPLNTPAENAPVTLTVPPESVPEIAASLANVVMPLPLKLVSETVPPLNVRLPTFETLPIEIPVPEMTPIPKEPTTKLVAVNVPRSTALNVPSKMLTPPIWGSFPCCTLSVSKVPIFNRIPVPPISLAIVPELICKVALFVNVPPLTTPI